MRIAVELCVSVCEELKMTSTKTQNRTRQQQRAASKAALLDAASDLFGRFGFEGVSVNRVADQSGISKQNLVYYFGSKEGLWKAAVEHVFMQFEAKLARDFSALSDTATPSLQTFIRIYFEACRKYPAYVKIPMIEGVNRTWRSTIIAEKYLARHIPRFESYTRSLIERGDIADVPALHLQNLIAGGAQHFIAMAPIWSDAIDLDTKSRDFLKSYADTVIKLLS